MVRMAPLRYINTVWIKKIVRAAVLLPLSPMKRNIWMGQIRWFRLIIKVIPAKVRTKEPEMGFYTMEMRPKTVRFRFGIRCL